MQDDARSKEHGQYRPSLPLPPKSFISVHSSACQMLRAVCGLPLSGFSSWQLDSTVGSPLNVAMRSPDGLCAPGRKIVRNMNLELDAKSLVDKDRT
eukprot:3337281-Amphidinium_carterae.1